jgi:steroid 5-alpha reductase family enzyme
MEVLVFNSSVFAGLILVSVSLVYLLAQIKNDNSIMDIAYGPIFLLGAIGTSIITESFSLLSYVIIGCIALWSIRLSARIYKKNNSKKEDARYAIWRAEWSKKSRLYFLLRSYVQINLLQGMVIFFVSVPFILSTANQGETSISFVIIGLLVFFVGFLMESIADYQLDSFIARKKVGTETAPIMTVGLFRFSRRPNYFGETLIWWGLAIMVLPIPFGFIGLISPIIITYIVTRVTGPMLEKIFLDKYPTEYANYQKKTSYFVPLPPHA